MRKKILPAVLMIASVLAGCTSDDRYVEPEKDTLTIRTVTMFGGTDANAIIYEQIREEFMNENPGIYVMDESRTSDEQWKKEVVTDFCVGNEPDVLQFFTDATADQLIMMDKFVSIEEIREYEPDYAKDTYEWALSSVTNSDGVQRAVPTTGFWEGLYCNRDLFEKYQVEYPTDWDSLQRAVEIFYENGVIPVACSIAEVPHYWMEYMMLYCVGEEAYVTTPMEENEDWYRALELFQELREMHAFPPNADVITNEYARQLFIQKDAAMMLEGNWLLPSIEDQENTIVIPFPGVPEPKEDYGTIISGMSSGFYITRRAFDNPEKRDAVVRYVMAQTSTQAVQRYWENGGGTARAATITEPMDQQTPLAMSVNRFLAQVKKQVMPLDSRMDAGTYTKLIAGITEAYNGGSPEKIWGGY